jgi:predicted DNA-binding protein (MmcQ/YjbR family)
MTLERESIEAYLLSLPQVSRDYPFGPSVAVYKAPEKMFALVSEAEVPLQISLKCDPQLSTLLREKYETVMPGYHLNKKHWNTILLTGQLDGDEVRDLIRHSYELILPTVIN